METSRPITTNVNTKMKQRKRSLSILGILKYIFIWGYAAITLSLFAWVAMTAFKSNREIFADPFGLPTSFDFGNFVNAWHSAKMSQFFTNSVIVTVTTVILSLFLGSLVSFVIARFKFKGNALIYSLFVLGIAIPLQSLLLPIFFRMDGLGLRGSLLGLIIVYTALNLPKTVFVLVGFMKSLPKELEEAAIVDGASIWSIYYRIIMPLSKPGLATAGILVFIAAWNEYVFATILITSDAARTLPLGMASFQTSFSSEYGLIAAGVIISIIPVLIIYILLQEQIIKGMTAGAVKG